MGTLWTMQKFIALKEDKKILKISGHRKPKRALKKHWNFIVKSRQSAVKIFGSRRWTFVCPLNVDFENQCRLCLQIYIHVKMWCNILWLMRAKRRCQVWCCAFILSDSTILLCHQWCSIFVKMGEVQRQHRRWHMELTLTIFGKIIVKLHHKQRRVIKFKFERWCAVEF